MHGGRGTGGWVGPRPCTEGITSEWASGGKRGRGAGALGLQSALAEGLRARPASFPVPPYAGPGAQTTLATSSGGAAALFRSGGGAPPPNVVRQTKSRALCRARKRGPRAAAAARARARVRAPVRARTSSSRSSLKTEPPACRTRSRLDLSLPSIFSAMAAAASLSRRGGRSPAGCQARRARAAHAPAGPLSSSPPPGRPPAGLCPRRWRGAAPGVSVLLPKQGTHLMMCAPASQTDRRRTHHRQTGQAGGQPPRASQRASRGAANREDRAARRTEAGVVARHARAELAIKQHARGGHAGASNSCFITASTTRRHALPGAPPCAPLAIEYAPHALAGWDLSTRGVLSLFARTRAGHEGRAQGQKKERQRASESICSLFPRTYTGSARGRRRGDQRSKSPPHAARARLTAASASAPDARKSGSAAGGRCVAHARTHARTRPRLLVRARAHDRQRSPAMRGEQRARR